MFKNSSKFFFAFAIVFISLQFGFAGMKSVLQNTEPEKTGDGLIVHLAYGNLKVEVCTADIIRIAFSKDPSFFDRKSMAAAAKRCEPTKWDVKTDGGKTTLTTASASVQVDLLTGTVGFFDKAGKPILAEEPKSRALVPATVQGEKTFHVRQRWLANADESLYGLGQNQLGLLDIKGYDLDLWQHNGTVVIPMLVSSKGYGIFWDNPSFTRFGDLRDPSTIPPAQLFDKDGRQGSLSASYYSGSHFDRMAKSASDGKEVSRRIRGAATPFKPSLTME